jgi:3-dehydroquinate synthase
MDTIRIKTRDSYNVYLGKGILQGLPGLLKDTSNEALSGRALIYIVTDRNVARHYLKGIVSGLKNNGYKIKYSVFSPGESLKNHQALFKLLQTMVKRGLTRDSMVIGLGGGVIGDFSGFAASIYMRGCGFVQIPTTLLAQVDSSVGGKVGINLKEGKNLVGSFYNPAFVLSDINTLHTLEAREIICGIAEIIKSGLIFSSELFEELLEFFGDYIGENKKKAQPADIKKMLLSDTDFLQNIIHKSISIKGEIVRVDERESDLRMILNFGHTFGHAVEKLTRYKRFLHGEAVLLGMKIASQLSHACGRLGKNDLVKISGLLSIFGIPALKGLKAKTIFNQMNVDKKKRGGKITYIVLEEIGRAVSETEIDDRIVMDSIEKVLAGQDAETV